ncbi:MAG TPA: protein-L-isoaspartate(D-aspartate) O-methyltransferase [Anaeromyxobacteraceae bacterium]|nr:protein-L-isoaspartate(D-aspartate) O-methyltransferase [Anaeromyxobacteraceae bacterium]
MSRTLALELFERGIRDERVLWAIAQVERRLFVPPALRLEADDDRPLPIGHDQTISQPYVTARMTEELGLRGGEKVLEVGTGSGYQTALLSLLAGQVLSMEVVPDLAARAAEVLLGALALENVRLRVGDGTLGWPEEAPFDRVLVTAAPEEVPEALFAQLAPGGRMVVPVGPADRVQELLSVEKGEGGRMSVREILPVRFVPLVPARPALH